MNFKTGFLIGTLLLAVAARAQQPRLACPLSYDPVVDPDSGLPFFNECLARLQLPSETKIVRRSALEAELTAAAATAATGARRLRAAAAAANGAAAPQPPSAADYLKLLPKPAAGSDSGDGVFVDLDIINKYSNEGFVYVGRPGFLTPTQAPASPSEASSGSSSGSGSSGSGSGRAAPSAPAPLSMDGSRVSLRIAYPRGDMYVKIWSAAEIHRMTAQHTATTTSASVDSSSPARSNTPDDDLPRGTAALAAAAAAATATAATAAGEGQLHPRAARRLLASNGGGTANGSGNGNGNGNGGAAGPNRTEVTLAQMSYPYSAVSYINVTRINFDTTWCTGAMAGPTSRLVLTAAHCVYDFDQAAGVGRGYHQAFVVIPGQTRDANTNTIAMPYPRLSTNLAEVMAQWMLKGNFDFDIGLIRLAVHATLAGRAPGFLPYGVSCDAKSFSLASAGYAGDKGFNGSLWTQSLNTSAGQCGGSVAQKVAFAFAPGQDGSPLWSSPDNVIRFVTARTGLAVPISPTYFSWMQEFTSRTILNLVPLQLQGGFSSLSQFFTCNPDSRKCVGSRKDVATNWFFHPVSVPRKWALRYPGRELCLTANSTANITATAATVAAFLAPCNTDGRFTFPPNQLWNVDTFPAVGAIAAAKTDNDGYLSCAGDGQPLLARGAAACAGQSACSWRQVSA